MLNPADIYTKDRNWQAKIQLRPEDYEDLEALDNFIKEMIAKRHDCFITKEEEVKTGIDYYLNNQKYAQIIMTQLKKKFGGKITLSRQLFSQNRQTSKSVYRLTLCYRPDPKPQEEEE